MDPRLSKITERQKKILAFIKTVINVHGVSPTLREISTHFGFASTCGAVNHLKALEKKGFIRRVNGEIKLEATV